MAHSAIVDPTEMSIPPVIITNVIPQAMIPTKEASRKMEDRLLTVKNSGVCTEKTAIISRSRSMDVSFLAILRFICLTPHISQPYNGLFRYHARACFSQRLRIPRRFRGIRMTLYHLSAGRIVSTLSFVTTTGAMSTTPVLVTYSGLRPLFIKNIASCAAAAPCSKQLV